MTNYDFMLMLSHKYYKDLFQYVDKICTNKAIIADIVQDTLLIAYQKADELQNHKYLSGWLYRTARYRMLQLLVEALDYDELSSLSDSISDKRNYEDECIAIVELYPEMSKYIEPDDLRLILRYYEEGYMLRELAEEYHTTEASIKMKLLRTRQKLRDALEKHYI